MPAFCGKRMSVLMARLQQASTNSQVVNGCHGTRTRSPCACFGSFPASPGAKDQQRCAGQAKEEDIDGHDVIEDLLIPSRHRHEGGPDTLQDDGDHRNPRARIELADRLEENAVARHRVINAGSGENALAEKADRRDRRCRRR